MASGSNPSGTENLPRGQAHHVDMGPSDAEESLANHVEDLGDALDSGTYWRAQDFRGRLWRVDSKQWEEIMHATFEDSVAPEKTLKIARASVYQDARSAFDPRVLVPRKQHRSVCGLPVLDPANKFVSYWKPFLTFFDLTYTAFIVPVSVFFRIGSADSPLKYVDIAAGILFMLALALGFHTGVTAQHDLRRLVVKDGRLVARHYIWHGSFFIDLISSFVYLLQIAAIIYEDNVTEYNKPVFFLLNTLQLLRMVRLVHIFSQVQKLLVHSTVSRASVWGKLPPWITTLLVIGYMLYWVINLYACLWFFVASFYVDGNQPNWIAVETDSSCYSVHFAWKGPQPVQATPPDCDYVPTVYWPYIYLVSIYWSVTTMTTVGYGDITPNNVGEIVVALLAMLGGIMTFAALIGTMQDIISSNSDDAQKAYMLRGKLAEVESWIQATKLPKRIAFQIRKYYFESWIDHQRSDTFRDVFLDMPEQLQGIVATHLTSSFLPNTRIFKDIDEGARCFLASKLNPVILSVGHNICSQGDVADRLWILESGYMVSEYGATTAEVEAAPALIGETTILQDKFPKFEHRPCGYCATTHCHLWELSRRDLQVVVRLYPHVGRIMYRGVAQHLLERAGIVSRWGAVDVGGVKSFIQEIKQIEHDGTHDEKAEGHATEDSRASKGATDILTPPLTSEEASTGSPAGHGPQGAKWSPFPGKGVTVSPDQKSSVAVSQVSEMMVEGVGEVETAAIIDLAMDFNEELRQELRPVQEYSDLAAADVDNNSPDQNTKLLKEILVRLKDLESSISQAQRGSGGGMAGGIAMRSPRSPAASPTSALRSRLSSLNTVTARGPSAADAPSSPHRRYPHAAHLS